MIHCYFRGLDRVGWIACDTDLKTSSSASSCFLLGLLLAHLGLLLSQASQAIILLRGGH